MSTYSALILADGAVGYWRLGEPSGTTATDAVGANNGTYVNSPVLAAAGAIAGDADTAITLNGDTNFRRMRVAAVPLAATDNFTVECWVKPGASQDESFGTLVHVGTQTVGYGLHIDATNHPRGLYNAGSGLTDGAAAALSTAAYSHVVLRRLSGTASVWVNGVQADPGTNNTGTPSTPTTNTLVGCWDGALFFYKGSIDEVALYNSALSNATILNHYNVGAGLIADIVDPFGTAGFFGI